MARFDDRARERATGEFVKLSEGVTHYQLEGPEDGPVVVLIHGFSVPMFVWDPVFEVLVSSGFRVLRYDLFGRGYSDRPRGRYSLARFDRQLMELISALHLELPLSIVGLSMGGAIGVGVTDRHPNAVGKLVLIDPAGMPSRMPLGYGLLKVPVLGELLMAMVGKRVLMSELQRDIRAPDLMMQLMERYREQYIDQMRSGFLRALLSTIRHGPLNTMAAAYARVGRQERRVLLIWGREDAAVPFAVSEDVISLMPNADFHPIEGAGHAPHLERPEVVNRLLLDFLSTP